MDCSLSGSFIHGILQARLLEWVAIPSSRGSLWPRGWTQVSWIAGRFFFFTIWATTEALYSISSVQLLSCVQLFANPWTAASQASLSITNTRSPPKPMSIESVMPSNYLILCCPILLLPSIFPSIRVFSDESALHIRWPDIGVSASASVLAVNTQDSSPLGWSAWISLQSKRLSRVFSNTTVQKYQFFGAQPSL